MEDFRILFPLNQSWEELWRDFGKLWDPSPTMGGALGILGSYSHQPELGEALEGPFPGDAPAPTPCRWMCQFGMCPFRMCRSQIVPPRSAPCHPPAISAPDLCHSQSCPRDRAPEAIKPPRIWDLSYSGIILTPSSAGGEGIVGMVPWGGTEPSDPVVWD